MLTRWGLIAGLAAAGALVAAIVYYRDHIIQGVTGAGFTAGQSIGAIPSSLAGGLQSGLNPLREVLGQAPAPVPTYTYAPPVINSNPAIQAAQPQQLTAVAPALPTPRVPVPLTSGFVPNPSTPATRSASRSRNSRYVAGGNPQTLVSQRTNPVTGRVQTKVSTSPISAYYAGTPTRRTTIHFSPTNKVTTQLSKAAIDTYRKYGVKLT